MFKSIKWKFVAIYVLLVTIVMLFSGTFIIVMVNDSEVSALEEELHDVVNIIDQDISYHLTDEEIEGELINKIRGQSLFKDKKIFLLDNKGNVIFPNQDGSAENLKYKPQVKAALKGISLEKIDVNITFDGDPEVYGGYAKAVSNDANTKYVIYALGSTGQIKETLKNIINIILVAVGIAIVISIMFGTLFSTLLTKPIALLTHNATEMAAGNLEVVSKVESRDEIGQLSNSFNMMARSLNDILGQISSEKNKLEFLFAQITDGIVVFDYEGKLTHTNPASIKMLDIEGKGQFDEIFYRYLSETFKEIVIDVTEGTITNVIKVRERYFNISLAQFSGLKENFLGIICVIQDITEHKKLELMQKEFVANVSHELRTPLTTIKSYTETLLEGAIDEKEIALNFLQVVNQESDRMTDLVKDLLELSRLDNKQTNFDMKEIDLGKIVEESVNNYRIHASKKQQQLTFEKLDEAFIILGDKNRIEQVVKNIVSNAVKYSPNEADIRVQVYKLENTAIIKVEDNGFGIPKEDVHRVFERFYRVNKARSREMGGTGLGLAIAKEIVEYHGGNIEVESELDKGTIFYLKFPLFVRK